MTLLQQLSSPESWEAFYEYKTSLVCPKDFAKDLRSFIDSRQYLPVCERIAAGERFPLPKKVVLNKMGSQKKRTVYIYPEPENTVCKLLTWLMLRKYDGLFTEGLYSFRPGVTAKDALRRLARTPGIRQKFAYKVDVSNYFNSVPIHRLIPMLGETIGADDPTLFAFLRRLLEEPFVLENGSPIEEQKGIMAGTPQSAFLANLYLRDLDRLFEEKGILYARYSDDIIVFGETREETEQHAAQIRAFLAEKGLSVNPAKEDFYTPETGWTFLGFSYRDGVIDIAPATVKKLKQKMRRKARALQRWRMRNGVSGEKAAAAFIRVFNRKLLESPEGSELSWSYWFFSVINTAESLKEIDAYAQDCLRFLLSGRRTKSRYNVRYEELKKLGYRSLVNAYYASLTHFE
ncbi:MAG: hypothetical protein IKN20_09010 [Firmicutes bacterium]|nr:hypothetical protein [Bacillota bacterium]